MHIMRMMEELMPSIGSSVPSPSLLSVLISQSDSTLQNIGKLYSDAPNFDSWSVDYDNPFDFSDDTLLCSKTHLISISDDGKIWSWLLTAEGLGDVERHTTSSASDAKASEVPATNTEATAYGDGLCPAASKQQQHMIDKGSRTSSSMSNLTDTSLKVCEFKLCN